MSYISKPKFQHPDLEENEIGLTRRDYEGTLTTLCGGCGHDSISAAIILAAAGMVVRFPLWFNLRFVVVIIHFDLAFAVHHCR